jgi:thiol-disulfide isomerase/thioredoxin
MEAEQKAFAGPAFLKAADLAHDFYTKYPKDKRADQAKFYEMRALNMAERMGQTNAVARLKKAEKAQLDDPNASPESRFQVRFSEIERDASAKGEPGSPGFNDTFEKGLRELKKEFPKQPEIPQLLVQLASFCEPAKAKQLAEEVVNSDAPEQLKEMAKSMVAKLDRIGKPLDVTFKAVDGRDVDLKKLNGKVVLVDFWATWCVPCVGEIPHVKEAYAELHPKGFEVVGISLDSDKSKLTKFVADQKMEWPQYYAGKQWQNEISTRYGIQSIPAMWLIDKKGNLRDINARADLKGKIEKLMAE